jgi:hypothetical protein
MPLLAMFRKYSILSSMIYARIPEYDVYVFRTEQGPVQCSLCSFGDMLEAYFRAESTQEMIDHLKSHERKGDTVPGQIYEQLLADDPTNYPPKTPFRVPPTL